VPKQRDRWKRGVDMVNRSLGEGVGQIYVQRHYPPESDRQMHELIDNILAALKEKISNNSWMDAPTKARALGKLATFDPRIGHPVKYIDYSSLAVNRGDLLGNAVRSDEFEWNLLLSRYTKPVDRTLWDMLPRPTTPITIRHRTRSRFLPQSCSRPISIPGRCRVELWKHWCDNRA
jgi:endothelin-converting enzyme/putative endopeptidase